ncbi:MAG TPA: LLM class flavin-dependent oxidoreductase [Acidimicrobiales bacterium]|nr:LLM class flavin-dependent oxidoreductase [Acidimicrobiales bacterium]
MTSAEAIELARLAEEVGFDRLGISDVVFWPDCFVLLALAARETTRIELGPMVTNPYSRHPAVLAGIMATLQDASDGRAFLGIGVGAGLEQLGMAYERPVAALREAVTAIRALLRGEEVHLNGRTITIDGGRMVGPVRPVPVSIGSRSPQILRLAGELADVALVGGRLADGEVAAGYRRLVAEGAARAGRSPEDVEIALRLTVCVSRDGVLARASVRRYAAHYAAIVRPPDLAERDGGRWMARVEAALARSKGWYFAHDRSDDPELDELVDDEVVRRFAVAGTPAECAELASRALALGFTSASMNLAAPRRPSMFEGLRETLEGCAEVLARLRATARPGGGAGGASG